MKVIHIFDRFIRVHGSKEELAYSRCGLKQNPYDMLPFTGIVTCKRCLLSEEKERERKAKS